MRIAAILTGLALTAALALSAQAEEAPTNFIEGKHYQLMSVPVPPIAPNDKVEVTEIFRFGCPHCYHFEDKLQPWADKAPAYMVLEHNPVVWDNITERRATVYYAGIALKLEKEVRGAIFKSIHEAANPREASTKAMMGDEEVLTMFEGLGVDRAKADKMMKNSTIRHRVRQADGRARAFAVTSTPEIVVDGRYRVTIESAGGMDGMLQVTSYLVDKIAAERGLK